MFSALHILFESINLNICADSFTKDITGKMNTLVQIPDSLMFTNLAMETGV